MEKRVNDWELYTKWRCPDCGGIFDTMTNFCPECGKARIYEEEKDQEATE